MTIDSTDLRYAAGLRRTGARSAKVSAIRLDLPLGQAKSCVLCPGDEVRCTQGRIWVTFSGDSRDFVLKRGESAFAPARGRAVVQAMGQDGEARIVSFAS
jgi:hypothetical protein